MRRVLSENTSKLIGDSEAGLTIIELLIVLVILSLVVTVTTVQIMNQFQRAQSDVLQIQLQKLRYALELYQIDVGSLPADEQGLVALLAKPENAAGWRGPYISAKAELLDPWKTELRIENLPGGLKLISAGPNRTFDNGGDDVFAEFVF